MPALENHFARLGDAFFTRVNAMPLTHPHWVIRNQALARTLGIDWEPRENDGWLKALSGGEPLQGSQPLAMVYSGHQFGQYVAQLGDGRGLLLGDLSAGAARQELHLKGAGKTPYSRFGDGRAVLRSCIREYIASEALHALGVPTTRALCITSGSDTVWRETLEPCAMLTRVAQSHVRFGSFEYFHYTGQLERVQQLADYCVEHYYPALRSMDGQQRYAAFLQAVVERTAILVAKWQVLGFAHGVLNTDNMSIVGDTFDFGPYGFLDHYNPAFVCNHSDHHGRYAFNAQPHIGLWNLTALSEALASLAPASDRESALASYEPVLIDHFETQMAARLGLQDKLPGDQELIFGWLELLQKAAADYTLAFRALLQWQRSGDEGPLRDKFKLAQEPLALWLDSYRKRLESGSLDRAGSIALMQHSNPVYIPRNHLAQEAIEQADNGNYRALEKLMEVLANPYEEKPGLEEYAAPAPGWSQQLEISCSS